jgi:transposase, IS5 family
MLSFPAMAKRKRYINRADMGFFDKSDRLHQVQSMGDVLNQINSIMDWEIFMPVLERIPVAEAKGPGGRPGFHPMFMFKVLVLQSLFGLSDEQTQYQILDRRSFHDFLDITEADTVPDQNTIREFREKLTRAQLHDELFASYAKRLEEKGFITRKGNIVDASFVEVPRQRNRRAENESIKNGELPDGWEDDSKRLSHKDLDAKWTKKNQQTFYGYKNHANVDLESKLIVRAEVTDASVHDSQALDSVTCEGDAETWLDAGYVGPACEAVLAGKGIQAKICEKGARNRPLTAKQKRSNRAKSRKRCRVEHVFGYMTMNMKAMVKRYIGLKRNRASIIFCNLVYNIARTEQIIRLKLLGRKTPSFC